MLRLSEHFLLLDFLYGQSTIDCVVQCGDLLADRVASINEDWEEIAEGRYLCETVLEQVVERHGCVSIGAGLWFKNLPGQGGAHADGPHKWNRSSGAAADIVVHSWIDKDEDPKKFPHSLPSSDIEYHRALTYVGSEFCCLASRSAGNKYKAGYADWIGLGRILAESENRIGDASPIHTATAPCSGRIWDTTSGCHVPKRCGPDSVRRLQ